MFLKKEAHFSQFLGVRHQWYNSWGGGIEGRSDTLKLLTGKFLLTPTGKREVRKKRKMEKKKKENWKREGGENEERIFFFFLLFTFQNHWNLFSVYQNGNFLPGKSISCGEKNQEKWLCPLWKIFLLCLCSPYQQPKYLKILENGSMFLGIFFFRKWDPCLGISCEKVTH